MAATRSASPDRPRAAGEGEQGRATRWRLIAALAAGVGGLIAMGVTAGWTFAPLVGWDFGCVVLMAATWAKVLPMDAERTARLAVREEPRRAVTDLLLVTASVTSLIGVGFIIAAGGSASGGRRALLVALAIFTVVVSWGVVHTTFTLRYARLYYTGRDGGIIFKDDDEMAPSYSDFAYLAFTIGMTFQVSDTTLTSREMRATALRHALLSYLFGVVIIAVMINLLAGLSK